MEDILSQLRGNNVLAAAHVNVRWHSIIVSYHQRVFTKLVKAIVAFANMHLSSKLFHAEQLAKLMCDGKETFPEMRRMLLYALTTVTDAIQHVEDQNLHVPMLEGLHRHVQQVVVPQDMGRLSSALIFYADFQQREAQRSADIEAFDGIVLCNPLSRSALRLLRSEMLIQFEREKWLEGKNVIGNAVGSLIEKGYIPELLQFYRLRKPKLQSDPFYFVRIVELIVFVVGLLFHSYSREAISFISELKGELGNQHPCVLRALSLIIEHLNQRGAEMHPLADGRLPLGDDEIFAKLLAVQSLECIDPEGTFETSEALKDATALKQWLEGMHERIVSAWTFS
jgi:hypothetical protein